MAKNYYDPIALYWNRLACDAVYYAKLPPTRAARALAMVHTAMYDAWSAYSGGDEASTTTGHRLKQSDEKCTSQNRKIALSYAAYRVLETLLGPHLADSEHQQMFADFMEEIGCKNIDETLDISKPQGIGNLSAKLVLECRMGDGANQANKYADYTGYKPVNEAKPVKPLKDIGRWQPQLNDKKKPQVCLDPHWGLVKPFALRWGGQFRPEAPPPPQSQAFRHQVEEIIHISACLTPEQKLIAEFWAGMHEDRFEDTAFVEQYNYWAPPPLQSCRIARYIARKNDMKTGLVVPLFFALTNALLDASIAAWDAKIHYDYCRPDSAIHEAYDDECIDSWGGPCRDTVQMEGEGWCPYLGSTPPFPEYVSGHSTFSRATAEIIKCFCGSYDYGECITIQANGSKIEPECTPAEPVILQWEDLLDAANQAGNSRRYGGIHFESGDKKGRELGANVAICVWAKANWYFNGMK